MSEEVRWEGYREKSWEAGVSLTEISAYLKRRSPREAVAVEQARSGTGDPGEILAQGPVGRILDRVMPRREAQERNDGNAG